MNGLYAVSTACQKCGGSLSMTTSHKVDCEYCDGTEFVNEFSGGGTEPRQPWESPVIGTRIDRVPCRDGQILNVECSRCGNKFRAELRK